ncbi:MAG: DUF4252 domain-containing protein [Planctomycetota bacterium]
MSPISRFVLSRFGCPATAIALVMYSAVAASAQSADVTQASTVGRLDFAKANLPPATVEIELGPGMIGDLLGLGKAAIGGVAQTLVESPNGTDTTKLAAEQLAAVQEIVQISSEVVKEVRVRVYEEGPTDLDAKFADQLQSSNWNTIVKVHDGNDNVAISLVRQDGAVKGAFVVAADGDDLVLVNVVCDISPENVKTLTAKATQIGLDNGLQRVLEQKLQHLHHHHSHRSAHSQASHRDGHRPQDDSRGT